MEFTSFIQKYNSSKFMCIVTSAVKALISVTALTHALILCINMLIHAPLYLLIL